MGLWGSVSCNGVTQCWPAQRGKAVVPGSSPYMVRGKWIQARAHFEAFIAETYVQLAATEAMCYSTG